MKSLLTAQDQGTPLFIFEQKQPFETWLSNQTQFTQNWLKQISFSGNGLAVIPNEQGELAQAVFIVDNASHYFACGDLIKKLPAGLAACRS